MAQPNHPAGPKTAYRPPHKDTLLQGPPPNRVVVDPDINGSAYQLRQIGAPGSYQVLLPVDKKTVEAEAFVAPHDIEQAIQGLPQAQQRQVREALSRCLDSPEACDDGASNEYRRGLTTADRSIINEKGEPIKGGYKDPLYVRDLADHQLKEQQSIVAAEQKREAALLNRGSSQPPPASKRKAPGSVPH